MFHRANLFVGSAKTNKGVRNKAKLRGPKQQHSPDHPEENGTIGATAGEESLVDWMPREAADFLLVATEGLHVGGHVANVEDLDQMITRGGKQPVSVLIPLDIGHGVLVRVPANTKRD